MAFTAWDDRDQAERVLRWWGTGSGMVVVGVKAMAGIQESKRCGVSLGVARSKSCWALEVQQWGPYDQKFGYEVPKVWFEYINFIYNPFSPMLVINYTEVDKLD